MQLHAMMDVVVGVNHIHDVNQKSDESDEDDVEPKLTYERISNDVALILKDDSASCVAVHSKLLAMGTHSGKIYIFDHQGNKVLERNLPSKSPLHQISIDEKGEYFATCSHYQMTIMGIYTAENNYSSSNDRPVNSISIDPYFSKPGGGKKFIIGDDKVILYEKTFLSRYKTTILQQGRGQIRNIRWKGQFIAWASDVCIKIYDIEARAVITFIEREKDFDSK